MPDVGYELVNYEVADGVATVTLDNPEKRNMLSGQMLVELVDAMQDRPRLRGRASRRPHRRRGQGVLRRRRPRGLRRRRARWSPNTSPPTSSSSSSG